MQAAADDLTNASHHSCRYSSAAPGRSVRFRNRQKTRIIPVVIHPLHPSPPAGPIQCPCHSHHSCRYSSAAPPTSSSNTSPTWPSHHSCRYSSAAPSHTTSRTIARELASFLSLFIRCTGAGALRSARRNGSRIIPVVIHPLHLRERQRRNDADVLASFLSLFIRCTGETTAATGLRRLLASFLSLFIRCTGENPAKAMASAQSSRIIPVVIHPLHRDCGRLFIAQLRRSHHSCRYSSAAPMRRATGNGDEALLASFLSLFIRCTPALATRSQHTTYAPVCERCVLVAASSTSEQVPRARNRRDQKVLRCASGPGVCRATQPLAEHITSAPVAHADRAIARQIPGRTDSHRFAAHAAGQRQLAFSSS